MVPLVEKLAAAADPKKVAICVAAAPVLSTVAVLTAPERRDLLEILEDRHGHTSTIVTNQLPLEHWHEAIGDPTLADAILDRLVHYAHRLKLT